MITFECTSASLSQGRKTPHIFADGAGESYSARAALLTWPILTYAENSGVQSRHESVTGPKVKQLRHDSRSFLVPMVGRQLPVGTRNPLVLAPGTFTRSATSANVR